MGKSRKSTNNTRPRIEETPSNELVSNMKRWQCGGDGSPDKLLTDEEKDFIKRNMVNSRDDEEVPTGHLTRVEHQYHFIESGLKEGDILDTQSLFRAFSREPDATNWYMNSEFGRKEPIVIYRTNGNVPHYNITKHTGEFQREKESWVETGKLKIDKISHYTKENDDMRKVIREALELEKYPRELEQYSDETIEQYGFDPTPQDVMVVDVSYVE